MAVAVAVAVAVAMAVAVGMAGPVLLPKNLFRATRENVVHFSCACQDTFQQKKMSRCARKQLIRS